MFDLSKNIEDLKYLKKNIYEKTEYNIRRIVEEIPNGSFSIGFGLGYDLSFIYEDKIFQINEEDSIYNLPFEDKIKEIIDLIDSVKEESIELNFSTNDLEYYETIEPKLNRSYDDFNFARYLFENLTPFQNHSVMEILNINLGDLKINKIDIAYAWNELLDISKIPLDTKAKDLFVYFKNNPYIENKDIINGFRNSFKFSIHETIKMITLFKSKKYNEFAKKYLLKDFDINEIEDYVLYKTKLSLSDIKSFNIDINKVKIGIRDRKSNESYGEVFLIDFINKIKERN